MVGKNARGKPKRKHVGWRSRKPRKKRVRKGLTFGFIMLVLFILAGMGVFMVAMQQGALSNDLSASRAEQQITAERAKQKSLRMSLARLKSPGRVTREAIDELGLSEPSAVIYLKYTKDGNGNIVCQSNYETTTLKPTRNSSQEQTGQEEPPETGKEQASIKTEISPKLTGR